MRREEIAKPVSKLVHVGRDDDVGNQLGDEIVFGQYAGSKINILGEELLLLREGDVMGIIS